MNMTLCVNPLLNCNGFLTGSSTPRRLLRAGAIIRLPQTQRSSAARATVQSPQTEGSPVARSTIQSPRSKDSSAARSLSKGKVKFLLKALMAVYHSSRGYTTPAIWHVILLYNVWR